MDTSSVFNPPRFSKKKKNYASKYTKHLPTDVLAEIFTKVASFSPTDLFNVKPTCKEFGPATDDVQVLKHASLNKFPLNIRWLTKDNGSRCFFTKCKENGNGEALFREGVVHYFDKNGDQTFGLKCLKAAAMMDHTLAVYTCGIITGGYVNNGKKLSKSTIRACRENMKPYMWSLWVNSDKLKNLCSEEVCNCTLFAVERRTTGWPCLQDYEEESDYNLCSESCIWPREAMMFRGQFNLKIL